MFLSIINFRVLKFHCHINMNSNRINNKCSPGIEETRAPGKGEFGGTSDFHNIPIQNRSRVTTINGDLKL